MPVKSQGGHLGNQRRGVACQRALLDRGDRLVAPGFLAGRQLGRQRLGDLVVAPLHERGHIAQPELSVTTRSAETVDLAGIGPPLHGRFPDAQQLGNLPGRQDVGLHGQLAPMYQVVHRGCLRAFRAFRCGGRPLDSESQTLLMSVRSRGCAR